MFLLTLAKCLPLLNGKITVGLAEMDKMNKSEQIYDNSCLLSFVCLTYNLTIDWKIASKVRLVAHVLYRQWRAGDLF